MKVQIQMCNCKDSLKKKKKSGKMQATPDCMINKITLSHSVMLIHPVLLLASLTLTLCVIMQISLKKKKSSFQTCFLVLGEV